MNKEIILERIKESEYILIPTMNNIEPEFQIKYIKTQVRYHEKS